MFSSTNKVTPMDVVCECIAQSPRIVSYLMDVVVRVFVLVSGNVPGLINNVLSPGDAFAFASFVKSLLRRAGVLGCIRKTIHRSSCFTSL